MVTETLRSLHNGPNYISNNDRLLVGWLVHVFEDRKTEVWLAKPPPPDADGKRSETKGWHIYTSADGSKLLSNLSELHPALLAHLADETSEEFMSRAQKDRLDFLSERYEDVVRGRYKYSEREGGDVKAMKSEEMFPRHKPKEGQKRKRDADCPEDSAEDKKRKLCASDYNNNSEDDDDEEPPTKREEPIEMDPMDQTPTVPGPAISDLRQPRAVQRQSHDQISASIASLGLTDKAIARDRKPADQKHDIREPVKPDPMALDAMAKSLRNALIRFIIKWALCADSLKRDLTGPAGELCVASNNNEILVASRKLLRHFSDFRKPVQDMRFQEQQHLESLRLNGLNKKALHVLESTAVKNEEMERNLKVLIEDITQRVEELQTGMM